ncbi:MAG: hypothetical protein LWX08_14715 [Deltaproteobacteria bacterium]|jgi:hypothetical protein|nr:hypothetical protein [Deltaproteobacteria bacterium]
MNDDYKLTIEIKNDKPVELFDLTNSLLGLADEYKRFLARSDGPTAAEEVKLYVKEIKTGSIITDLVANAPYALPFVEHAKTIIDFSQYLDSIVQFFLGKKAVEPTLDKRNIENLSNFVEPVAKDGASQLNCNTTIHGNVKMVFNFNSVEANALQNSFRKKMEFLKEPITGLKKNVVLYWYQARNDPKSQAGDKAIIESIFNGPVKAVVDENIKTKMLSGPQNPFQIAYLVDVEVETVNNRPLVYKVQNLHDKYDKEE